MVVRDWRYQLAPQWRSLDLVRERRVSRAVSTLEVHPGHRPVRTAATRANNHHALRRAAINVATTQANRTALAIWTERIAVPAAVTNERDMRFVHA